VAHSSGLKPIYSLRIPVAAFQQHVTYQSKVAKAFKVICTLGMNPLWFSKIFVPQGGLASVFQTQ
jgi:hypothetical protein